MRKLETRLEKQQSLASKVRKWIGELSDEVTKLLAEIKDLRENGPKESGKDVSSVVSSLETDAKVLELTLQSITKCKENCFRLYMG